MSQKILSVIVPAYKFSKYIEKCIDSIYSQRTDFDFDVIVRDDFSNDGTAEILDKMKKEKYPDLIILEGSKNIGSLRNLRRLIENCSSKYISHIDGDDLFFDESKLQRQIDFLENNPDYSLHFTACEYLYDDGTGENLRPGGYLVTSLKEEIMREDLLHSNYVGFGRTFRNHPLLIKEYFEESPVCTDWLMNYELLKRGKAKYEQIHGGFYRISESGVFSTLTNEEKNTMSETARKAILDEESRYVALIKAN
jgi:glycosyltransferase involved in cell wall biosynthesis